MRTEDAVNLRRWHNGVPARDVECAKGIAEM